jgi:hypothetical protein
MFEHGADRETVIFFGAKMNGISVEESRARLDRLDEELKLEAEEFSKQLKLNSPNMSDESITAIVRDKANMVSEDKTRQFLAEYLEKKEETLEPVV